MEKTVLVTGGTGYLGSHLAKRLRSEGFRVVTFDRKIPKHTHYDAIYYGDVRDHHYVEHCFSCEKIDYVIHCAGRIEVGESMKNPMEFWDINVGGTLTVLNAMNRHGVKKIIFSSTAGIFADAGLSVYAQTKLICEEAIRASKLQHVIFRYFNLAGADSDGELGEQHEPETHLIPRILQNLNNIEIYGDDYDTEDGTCIRDYVHIEDVVDAHIKAINVIEDGWKNSTLLSLGSGVGYSVKQIIDSVQKVVPQRLNYKVVGRRYGDPDKLIAEIEMAKEVLDWEPKRDIMDIVVSAYNWEQKRKAKC